MVSINIRNLPDETFRALSVRATSHGRSVEAEVMAIVESAVRPENRVKLGTLLAEIGREAGYGNLELERDQAPTQPVSFEVKINE